MLPLFNLYLHNIKLKKEKTWWIPRSPEVDLV